MAAGANVLARTAAALRRWLALLWLIGAAWGVHAQDLQPVPALSARVIDQAQVMSTAQREALEARLAAFEASAGPQIVVLTVASTAPEDIAAYAHRVADAWKIGRREVGDGLLIVVATQDRRLRIEVARALEGAVPDLAARQIIQNQIAPAFRDGDFAGGLTAGVEALINRLSGEGLPAPAPRGAAEDGLGLHDLLLFFFVAVPIVGAVLSAVLGRRLGSLATAGVAGWIGHALTASLLVGIGAGLVALVLVGLIGLGGGSGRAARGTRHGGPPIIWGGGGGRGGGWGGGGGGFSSGGGGSFGGGGASGSW